MKTGIVDYNILGIQGIENLKPENLSKDVSLSKGQLVGEVNDVPDEDYDEIINLLEISSSGNTDEGTIGKLVMTGDYAILSRPVSGSAYGILSVYNITTGELESTFNSFASDSDMASFGETMAISNDGSYLTVGAPDANDGDGAVYTFDLSDLPSLGTATEVTSKMSSILTGFGKFIVAAGESGFKIGGNISTSSSAMYILYYIMSTSTSDNQNNYNAPVSSIISSTEYIDLITYNDSVYIFSDGSTSRVLTEPDDSNTYEGFGAKTAITDSKYVVGYYDETNSGFAFGIFDADGSSTTPDNVITLYPKSPTSDSSAIIDILPIEDSDKVFAIIAINSNDISGYVYVYMLDLEELTYTDMSSNFSLEDGGSDYIYASDINGTALALAIYDFDNAKPSGLKIGSKKYSLK